MSTSVCHVSLLEPNADSNYRRGVGTQFPRRLLNMCVCRKRPLTPLVLEYLPKDADVASGLGREKQCPLRKEGQVDGCQHSEGRVSLWSPGGTPARCDGCTLSSGCTFSRTPECTRGDTWPSSLVPYDPGVRNRCKLDDNLAIARPGSAMLSFVSDPGVLSLLAASRN